MTEESQSFFEYLPHLTVLVVLIVLEYWIFMSHATLLPLISEIGDFVGIQLLLALVVIIIIVFGLYSICENKLIFKKLVSIALILFTIQMVLILVQYIMIAMSE
ncbi:MAG: hypothetical protein PVG65_05405 [Candidatus Thorarchaeota archaeon]|jgi:hypothetical protein